MSELKSLRIVRCDRMRLPRELSGALMDNVHPSKVAQTVSSGLAAVLCALD
jgi:hypothetical protein